ncbi:hypothetical protein IMSAGC014_02330 [Bacteroidaceae bacterium]|uniref:beta barrel domain-containing protein n=1 Tax=Bacteroidales TaxID=171549 RepID=UPI0010936615|nr:MULTISPECIES: hypothetical protein [Bacteroidales]TGY03760.1 hypothetical protein E5354_09735 [Muribaculum sp. NM65_B17]THG42366.1 hypothetical protein E5985_09640 [Muribaculaceae bacterium]GFI35809.1 hypothetical protein IMSAGC014_02330 [Bacteroidaceae bacterium]GFI38304.1 hypothetical protein IMSAGC016_00064 [Muribaculaceae bacterium]
MEQCFENIKVGDSVVFCASSWYNIPTIAQVTRVTPKQFEAGAYRFRKKDGSMVGDAYRSCRLATEEDVINYKKEQRRISLRNKITQFFKSYDKTKSLTIEELEKIESVIKNKL